MSSYRCPSCLSPRSSEKRETIKNEITLLVKYEDGCEMKLIKRGAVWKFMHHICKKNPLGNIKSRSE